MKYIKQLLIILFISLLGEGLKLLLPFPIPASIYGMVLLFLALLTGVLKLEAVKETGLFLVQIMPIMFIPAGVGLMEQWPVFRSMLVPVLLATFLVLLTVMLVTGRVAQRFIRGGRDRRE